MKTGTGKLSRSYSLEHAQVQFCGCGETPAAGQIEIDLFQGANALRPDPYSAFVEFRLAHAFPVVNNYGTAIHPQVLSNSWRTLRWKCFNLAHLMRAYSETNPRDRILGCVLGVEFPEPPPGGWVINWTRETAPGLRAVATLFKHAEQVAEILRTYELGANWSRAQWTVSIENLSWLSNSGFLVQARGEEVTGIADFAPRTPGDLLALGYVYVPAMEAPDELLRCLNNEQDDLRDGLSSRRIVRRYQERETILLLGGLDGEIFFNGVGLTPGGAMEPEAKVAQMLAAERFFDGGEAGLLPDFFAPLRKLIAAAEKNFSPGPNPEQTPVK